MTEPAAHNVLLIEVDQMPWFCLGAAGHPNVQTPNLDRLAREGGVRFDQAVCQSPICLPSRISMLAGQYPSTTGQFGFTGLCDRRMPWLPALLQQAGYATGAFGKFHVLSVGEDRFGFDVAAPSLPEDDDFARPKGNTYRAYCRDHGIHYPTDQNHGHDPTGVWYRPRTRQGHDLPENVAMAWPSRVPPEHSLETWTTDRAIDFVGSQNPDRPFFMWLTYDRPHAPLSLPEPWASQVEPDEVALPPLPPAEAIRTWPRSLYDCAAGSGIYRLGPEAFRVVLATYFKLIEYIDHEIGRVLAALEAQGLAKTTTVLFTADHGDEAGYNGLFDKARRASSEALTRVPLVVRPAPACFAKPPPGRVVDQPVELVDLFPTICSLTGVAPPAEPEGRDLTPTLLGDAPPDADRPVFCEEYHKRTVRHGDWKLVFDRTDPRECQLYHMAEDPDQFFNRYEEPDLGEVRIGLKRELLAFLVQRMHGPYTLADVQRMRRGLEPGTDPLPLHTNLQVPNTVHCFRCAAWIDGETHKLFVPFYEDDLLLVPIGPEEIPNKYCTRDRAVEPDPAVVEPLLDIAVRECLNGIHSISLLLPKRPSGPHPSAEEAEALLAWCQEA